MDKDLKENLEEDLLDDEIDELELDD